MADDPDTAISWITRITRFGWLSKGFVTVIIGLIAIGGHVAGQPVMR